MDIEKLREQFRREPEPPPKLAPPGERDAHAELSKGCLFNLVRETLLRLARRSTGWPESTDVQRLPYREDSPVEASDDVHLVWWPRPPSATVVNPVVVSVDHVKTDILPNGSHRLITYTVPAFPGEKP